MKTITNMEEKKLPIAIWALTFCAFGIGTAEFIIVGLLPTIANNLMISASSAGLLVTLYALGVAIGGPLITAFTGKMDRKKLLLLTMLLFVLGNLTAVFAPALATLLISRIISGATHGVFIGNAIVVAGNIVPATRKATSISIIFAGFLISTVIGVPLGTYIGTHWGWRTTFLVVSAWGFLGLMFITFLLPNKLQSGNILKIKEQLKGLKNGALILVLATNILAYTGTFIFFTFASSVLLDISKFSDNGTSVVLLILGLGVALGNIVGGQFSNKKPSQILLVILTLHALVLFILSLTLASQIGIAVSLFFFGFFAYGNVPALQLLSIQVSERAVAGSGNIASALNVSAFNVGAGLGAYLAGIIVDSSLGLKSTPWIGGLFVILSIILGIANYKRNKQYEK